MYMSVNPKIVSCLTGIAIERIQMQSKIYVSLKRPFITKTGQLNKNTDKETYHFVNIKGRTERSIKSTNLKLSRYRNCKIYCERDFLQRFEWLKFMFLADGMH
ncbi:hypothetical protein RF11_07840 [Thelohanellus kitauei]|uniref:Uncharacterized protein n=1 Tax=Thelohanellus kitauei TaxID=669202 RepID=A0A0C2IPP4_THEKT|nr:hypothetical protein RF11_07840 [Thelohanellus kitauei]